MGEIPRGSYNSYRAGVGVGIQQRKNCGNGKQIRRGDEGKICGQYSNKLLVSLQLKSI